MLLFLGLRTGFIVASLIPVVILITFTIMGAFDIGLDQISLAALIIALGMLVDNAIVMSESIIVQMEAGKKPVAAAIDSSKELIVPLLISSLTTSAAFLPFYMAKSATGEYVGSLFLVVSMTLIASWLISLTMIPIFCVFFLKVKKGKEPQEPKEKKESIVRKIYSKFLQLLLRNRSASIVAVCALFVLSLWGMTFVPKLFYPASDKPMFTVEIEMPVGSSIYRTEKVMHAIEAFMTEKFLVKDERRIGITNWGTYVGNGGPRYRLQHNPEPANPYYAFMLVNVTDYRIMPGIIKDLDEYIFETFPDAKPKIKPLEEGTPVDNPIEVRITGKEVDSLYALADTVKVEIEKIPGTKITNDDWGLKTKKVVIKIDEARARRAHITHDDIALSLESAVSGIALTELREDDKLIPLILRSEVAKEVELLPTESFNVFSQATGKSVPLKQIADVNIVWEPSIIFRRNRLKTLTVYSALEDGYTATEIEKTLVPWLEKASKKWPPGYKWALGGENEESGKAKRSIFHELPFAGLMILILLMLQFNCWKRTFIILRFVPIFPFWIVNLAAAFFRVSFWTYLWTTFLGIAPGSFVFTQAGKGLSAIFETGQEFSLATVFNIHVRIALIALGIFALIPILVKKFRKKPNA